MIERIIGIISAGVLGFLIGYEVGWNDKSSNRQHRLRKKEVLDKEEN